MVIANVRTGGRSEGQGRHLDAEVSVADPPDGPVQYVRLLREARRQPGQRGGVQKGAARRLLGRGLVPLPQPVPAPATPTPAARGFYQHILSAKHIRPLLFSQAAVSRRLPSTTALAVAVATLLPVVQPGSLAGPSGHLCPPGLRVSNLS